MRTEERHNEKVEEKQQQRRERKDRGKVTIREEEEEGKEKGGRRKVHMRTGEKRRQRKKENATRQKHNWSRKTGGETNKNKMLTVGTQCFNCRGNDAEAFSWTPDGGGLHRHRDGNHFKQDQIKITITKKCKVTELCFVHYRRRRDLTEESYRGSRA